LRNNIELSLIAYRSAEGTLLQPNKNTVASAVGA